MMQFPHLIPLPVIVLILRQQDFISSIQAKVQCHFSRLEENPEESGHSILIHQQHRTRRRKRPELYAEVHAGSHGERSRLKAKVAPESGEADPGRDCWGGEVRRLFTALRSGVLMEDFLPDREKISIEHHVVDTTSE